MNVAALVQKVLNQLKIGNKIFFFFFWQQTWNLWRREEFHKSIRQSHLHWMFSGIHFLYWYRDLKQINSLFWLKVRCRRKIGSDNEIYLVETHSSHLCSWKRWFHFCGGLPGKEKLLHSLGPLAVLCPTAPQIDYLHRVRYRIRSKLTRSSKTLPISLSSFHLPLSENFTVEFLEKLGSKLAMRGAMYCVAVSIRWVISPVKMNPDEEGQKNSIHVKNTLRSGIEYLVIFLFYSIYSQTSTNSNENEVVFFKLLLSTYLTFKTYYFNGDLKVW